MVLWGNFDAFTLWYLITCKRWFTNYNFTFFIMHNTCIMGNANHQNCQYTRINHRDCLDFITIFFVLRPVGLSSNKNDSWLHKRTAEQFQHSEERKSVHVQWCDSWVYFGRALFSLWVKRCREPVEAVFFFFSMEKGLGRWRNFQAARSQ